MGDEDRLFVRGDETGHPAKIKNFLDEVLFPAIDSVAPPLLLPRGVASIEYNQHLPGFEAG
jgi:hypothetical protein